MVNALKIKQKTFKTDWNGTELKFQSGKLAPQCDGSVQVQLGDTVLLNTAVMEKQGDPNKDYTPLMIDFKEKYYAGGKIGGARYIRRETKPSTEATLTARLTDRPIRTLLPEGMTNELIVTVSAFNIDKENHPGVPSIISSSLSIMLAGIPFDGPVGAVRIGHIDGEYIINPKSSQIQDSDIDILVAGKKDSINMIECESNEISTKLLMEALDIAQKEINKVCKFQNEFLKKFDIEPMEITVNKPSKKLISEIENNIDKNDLERFYNENEKLNFKGVMNSLKDEMKKQFEEQIQDPENEDFTKSKVEQAVFKVVKNYIRENILEKERRMGDRKPDEIRNLYTELDLYPQVHASSLFQRGLTQVTNIATLGAPGDKLIVDSMWDDEKEERYMHHYNFPPFSVNEARPLFRTSRRELGHGKLAEKALRPVLPSEKDFPYSIRLVSEVLSSNGSTSMAATCSSTLSLMAAGVPIKRPVSGIAMGLIVDSNSDNYKILTDIKGSEDFTGDMDFKITGTKDGITAIQLDTKVNGLSMEVMEKAIRQGNAGRNEILDFMLETIDAPRKELSPNAPLIKTMQLKSSQIKSVIGKGGENIDKIVEETGVSIDFDDDGTTFITANSQEAGQKAIELIKESAREPTEGETMKGKITRVESYGVFVNLKNNKQGLCHVSNLSSSYIKNVENSFKVGQEIKVEIIKVDDKGKIQLKKVK